MGRSPIRKDGLVWVGKGRDLEHRFEAETMIDAKVASFYQD